VTRTASSPPIDVLAVPLGLVAGSRQPAGAKAGGPVRSGLRTHMTNGYPEHLPECRSESEP
jgi:hypothetical protein